MCGCRNQTIEAVGVDDDVKEEFQSEGIQYIWLQKRFCETWPELLDNCTIDISRSETSVLYAKADKCSRSL